MHQECKRFIVVNCAIKVDISLYVYVQGLVSVFFFHKNLTVLIQTIFRTHRQLFDF